MGGRRALAFLNVPFVLAVVALFLRAVFVGGWFGIVAWVLTVILMLNTSVNVLFGFYDEPGMRWMGFWYWIATVFMGWTAVQMVTKSGEVRTRQPAGPLGDFARRLGVPSFVVIDAGMAAVFERDGRCTRISGPGIVTTGRFERVAYVIDLRRQVRSRPVKQVIARDGLAFDIDRLDVVFEVAGEFSAAEGRYVVPEEVLRALVYGGGLLYLPGGQQVEWGERVHYYVEHVLREVAATYRLEELVRVGEGANARQLLLEQIRNRAAADLLNNGVRLIGVDIGQISVPESVQRLLTADLRRRVDEVWAESHYFTIIQVARGLGQAVDLIRQAARGAGDMAAPHVVVNLSDTLARVAEHFLSLTALSQAGPEVRRLLQENPPAPPRPEPAG